MDKAKTINSSAAPGVKQNCLGPLSRRKSGPEGGAPEQLKGREHSWSKPEQALLVFWAEGAAGRGTSSPEAWVPGLSSPGPPPPWG